MFFMNNKKNHHVGNLISTLPRARLNLHRTVLCRSSGQRRFTFNNVYTSICDSRATTLRTLEPKGFSYSKPFPLACGLCALISNYSSKDGESRRFKTSSLVRKVSKNDETISNARVNVIRKILSSKRLHNLLDNRIKSSNDFLDGQKSSTTFARVDFDNQKQSVDLPTVATNAVSVNDALITESGNKAIGLSSKEKVFNPTSKIRTNFFLNKIYQKMPSHYYRPTSRNPYGLQQKSLEQLNENSLHTSPFNKAYLLKNTSILKKKNKQQHRAEHVFDSSYSKMTEINLITISLASANRIRQWAEKTLPNGKVVGEVINPETVHYKTLKPIKGGLFCERIFGPLKDHECACGKKFNIKNYLAKERDISSLKQQKLQKRYFCRVCDVEYTYSIIRRTQLGYIQLASPATHVWFVKGLPSYISILLDMKKKHLQSVTYNSDTLTLEHALRGRQFLPSSPTSIFESWQKIMKKQYPDKYIDTQATNPENVSTEKILDDRFNSTKPSKNQDLVLTKSSQLPQKTENKSTKSTLNLLNSKSTKIGRNNSVSINQKLLYKQNQKNYYARIRPLEREQNLKLSKQDNQHRTSVSDSCLRPFNYTSKFKFACLQSSLRLVQSKTYATQPPLWPVGPWFVVPLKGTTKKTESNTSSSEYQRSLEGKNSQATLISKHLDKPELQTISNKKKITNQKLNMSAQSVYERLPLNYKRKGWFNLAYYLLQIEQKRERKKAKSSSFLLNYKRPLLTIEQDTLAKQDESSIQHQQTAEERYSPSTAKANKLNSPFQFLQKNIFVSKQSDMQLLMIFVLKEFNSTLTQKMKTKLFKKLPRMSAVLNFCLTNSSLTSTNPATFYKQELLNLLKCNTKVAMPLYLLLKAKNAYSDIIKNIIKKDSLKAQSFNLVKTGYTTLPVVGSKNTFGQDQFIILRKSQEINRTPLEFSQQFLNYSLLKIWKICLKLNSKGSDLLKILSQKNAQILDLPLLYKEDKITRQAILASLEQLNLTVSFTTFATKLKTLMSSDDFTKEILTSLFHNNINKTVKSHSSDRALGQNALSETTSINFKSLTNVPTQKKGSSILHKRAFVLLIQSLKKYNLNNFEKQTTKIALMLLLNLKANALNSISFDGLFDYKVNSKRSTGLTVNRLESTIVNIFNLLQHPRQTKTIRKLYTFIIKKFSIPIAQRNGSAPRAFINTSLRWSCFARKDRERCSIKGSAMLTRYFYFIKQNKKMVASKLYESLATEFEVTHFNDKFEYLKNMFIVKTYLNYRNSNKNQYHDVPAEAKSPSGEVLHSANAVYKYEVSFDPLVGFLVSKETNFVNLSLNRPKIPSIGIGSPNQVNKPSLYFKNVKLWNPDKKTASFCESSYQNLFLKKINSSIVNNIYCLSHRELWEQDKDWQDFSYYYYSPTNIADKVVPLYKTRNFDLLFSIDNTFAPAANDYFANNQTLFVSSGMNLNTSFSGAGLIQKLLNEFNYTELKKMDKQNRILLFEYNKHVKQLKKKMNSRLLKSRTEYYKACHIRDVLIRRTKLTRKIFNKFLGNVSPVTQEMSSTAQSNRALGGNAFSENNNNILSQQGIKNRGHKSVDVTQTGSTTSIETNGLNMILTLLPVLPPVLRPVLKMSGQFTISDLNRLYQRIIYRNERLKKFLKDPALSSSFEMKYAQRLLQEAVDNLIQNGKSGVVPEKDARGRLLKSLSDILKGKQGRFRQYLLGKRVDYSGRSVIVVGPRLKLHECGIPKEMALVLYSPFLIKRILNQKLADTYLSAKKLIQTNPLLVSQLLREIMKSCPVLLNRAPTLHRLGFQAFQPKLVDGKAILLHPLVCPAFNADFDGDQMAVHVPITFEARAEAWKLMLTRNNLLSPATGEPIILPSQDMVLGCYYLTTNCAEKWSKFKKGSGMYFHSINDVLKAYSQQLIHVHAVIWVHIKGTIENGNTVEQPLEIRIPLTKYKINNASYGRCSPSFDQLQKDTKVPQNSITTLNYTEIYSKTHNFLILQSTTKQNSNRDSYVAIITNQIIRTTPGKILFNIRVKNAIEKRPALLSKYSSGTGLIKNKLISTFELQTDNFFLRKSITTNT